MIVITGKKAPLKFSKCCSPRFGDRIKGFYTKDKKIAVHREDCINIHALKNAREADIVWKKSTKKERATLEVVIVDKVGMLADLLNLFTKKGINVTKIQAKPKKDKTFKSIVEIENFGVDIEQLLKQIRHVKGVINVNVMEK